MANIIKEQQAILEKLNIHQLNPMQEEAIPAIERTKKHDSFIANRNG